MSKNSKIISSIVLGAVVGLTGLALPANAAVDTTNLTLVVGQGALTIDSATSATITLDGGAIAATLKVASGSIDDTSIVDTTGSLAGWSANVKFSNLQGATTNTKYIVLASDITANFGTATKYLRVTPGGQTTVSGNSNGLTTPTSQVTISSLSALDETGESNNFAVISASSGNGNGSYTFDTGLEIDVPAYGNYPASVTSGPISAQTYNGVATFQVSQ